MQKNLKSIHGSTLHFLSKHSSSSGWIFTPSKCEHVRHLYPLKSVKYVIYDSWSFFFFFKRSGNVDLSL